MSPNNIYYTNKAFDISSNKNNFNFVDFLHCTWLHILILIILGIVLRLPNLGESLWFDEVLYSTKNSMRSISDLWRLFLFDTPAPLYRVLMFFWITIFGENEIVVRIPSLLFGIFSIVLTYSIAKTYDSLKIAILAALLLCFSPVHIWYSQEATPYSMTLFFLLATFYMFRLIKVGHCNWKCYALYLCLLLITVFTHYYAAIFLLPLSFLALFEEKTIRRKVIGIHCLVITCLVVSLGIKYMTGHVESGMGFLRPFTFFEWWMLFLNWFSHGNSLWTVNPYHASGIGWQYLMSQPLLVIFQLFFLIILLRGLIPRSGRNDRKQSLELSLLLFSLPLVMFFLTQVGYRHLYIERYLIFILPFFLIVIGIGASGLSKRSLDILITLFLIIVSVASCIMFFYKSNTWTVYKQNPDWRSAAYYLSPKSNASDELIVVCVTPASTLKYYLRKKGVESFKIINFKRKKGISLLDNLNSFYLVKNEYWTGNFDKVFRKIKEDRRFRLVSSQTLKGLELYFFENENLAKSPLSSPPKKKRLTALKL